MSFHDLPDDWPRRPITDPEIVDDVLDLIVSLRDRDEGAVFVLLCHRDGSLLQPCAVTGPPEEATTQERRRVLTSFTDAVQLVDGGGIVLATARRRGTTIDDVDRYWHQSALEVCRESAVPLFGAYRVSLDGVTELPAPETAVQQLGA